MAARCIEDLEIWNRGVSLVQLVYKAAKSFPKTEVYGLASQAKRAAVSVPSNIAEGFARRHNAEYKQFLYVALGSCVELKTQIIIAQKLDFVTTETSSQIVDEIEQISKMTMALIQKL